MIMGSMMNALGEGMALADAGGLSSKGEWRLGLGFRA
jgi:hypothetical protein